MLNKTLAFTKIDWKKRIPQIISEIPINEVPEGWALLYDPKKSETLAMNEVGFLIYNSIDGKRNIGEIIDYVSSECEVSSNRIRKDIVVFINSLVMAKIVTWK